MIEFLMIFSGILLSSYCIYTDIKHGIIRNHVNIILILIAVFGHGYLILNGTELLLGVLLIFSEAVLFGFLLYYLGFLPSGDTKLFWSISFILPASFYANANKSLPVEATIFNIFVPMLVFLVAYILYKTTMQMKANALRIFSLSFLINHFVGFFTLVGTSIAVLQYFQIQTNFLFVIFLVIVLLELIKRLPINNWWIYVVLLVFTIINLDNILFFLMLAFIALFVRIGLEYFVALGSKIFLKEIKIGELTPNMSSAEGVVYSNGKYIKKPMRYAGISPFDLGSYEKIIIDPSFENMSKEEIENLKKLKKQGKLDFETILVNETIPFTPFIFFGFLLTVMFKGSFIYYLFNIL